MAGYTEAWIGCDGPERQGCGTRSEFRSGHSDLSSVRQAAKQEGWVRLSSQGIDLCPGCYEAMKGTSKGVGEMLSGLLDED